jgi:H/ACA ribonucleoprotein complex subunit 4
MSELPFEKANRTILIKKELSSSLKFGEDPNNRPVEKLLEYGVVNIDKPAGPTSHQVSAYARDILHLTKAGHSGTLDPNVTGVLAVALGRSTKIVQGLLTAGKEYVCLMHIHADYSIEKIKDICNGFVGNISQMPPLKSAVKRELRQRDIYYLDILEVDGRDVLFRVGCQAGTYIRKLCVDIGKALGTMAHMAELRRTKAGPFNESTIVTLQQLQDAYIFWKEENDEKQIRKCIQPVESAVKHLPKIWVSEYTVNPLCHGAALNVPGIAKLDSGIELNDVVAVMTLRNELIALGIAKMTSDEIMNNDKGVAVLVDSVFMEPETYPKMIRK